MSRSSAATRSGLLRIIASTSVQTHWCELKADRSDAGDQQANLGRGTEDQGNQEVEVRRLALRWSRIGEVLNFLSTAIADSLIDSDTNLVV